MTLYITLNREETLLTYGVDLILDVACSINAKHLTRSPTTMGELVDDFLGEKLCNGLFIYLWKCIALTGK